MRKWNAGDSQANYCKTAENRAIVPAGVRQLKLSTFFVPNFAIAHLGVNPK